MNAGKSKEIKYMIHTIVLVMLFIHSGMLPVSGSPETVIFNGFQLAQNSGEKKTVSVTIGKKTLRAVIADRDKTRTEGLLGWGTITDEEGMLLDFSAPGQYAIHMEGMKFPIDAVWIDSKGVIKLIYEKIQPNSGRVYPSIYSSRYCLEVKAGFCERYGVQEGQTISFQAP
jgi:uncharacterized membrane protein (UPF0127 family)